MRPSQVTASCILALPAGRKTIGCNPSAPPGLHVQLGRRSRCLAIDQDRAPAVVIGEVNLPQRVATTSLGYFWVNLAIIPKKTLESSLDSSDLVPGESNLAASLLIANKHIYISHNNVPITASPVLAPPDIP